MLNLIVSLAISLAVDAALIRLTELNVWVATIISVAVFGGVFLLLTRFFMKKIGNLMESAQRDLQANRMEKAVRTIESGFKYAPWQFFIKGQLNAQIGTIYYMKRDFSKAFEYLQKSFVRHWMAMAMLAICYMKRNKKNKMMETFDKATSANKKEPMLWNIYAFCLDKVGEQEKAISVMEKGLKRAGSNEILEENLKALKDGRKMKMQKWGDTWYQFHLEKPGALLKKQTKAVAGRRKTVVRR
ncbi:MAG: hypothetical protein GWO11_09010 [Desulfuromonadales bacterium]|nr:hypothetical protein [Desulfuromonadales bacterium]NIR34425.1 hypothetical protein [Desulfuromonadales bacterium]NIS44433.1 hypothetical protein [Desulfuromonadales bacterium]